VTLGGSHVALWFAGGLGVSQVASGVTVASGGYRWPQGVAGGLGWPLVAKRDLIFTSHQSEKRRECQFLTTCCKLAAVASKTFQKCRCQSISEHPHHICCAKKYSDSPHESPPEL
jgi:hypothetical protein